MPNAQPAPRRMSMTNLNTGEVLVAQFNPTEIEENLKVNWSELSVLGLSHKPLQYQNTSNHEFRFTLRFDAINATSQRVAPQIAIETFEGMERILDARNYLLSLCYAPRGAQAIAGGAPPRVLFFWPALAAIDAVIDSLRFRHTWFSHKGPARFDVEVVLKEILDVRIVSEDVRDFGTARSSDLAAVQTAIGISEL